MKPHKHAALIKKWADGDEIQYRQIGNKEWIDTRNPGWFLDCEYRVKPVTRKYRAALMSFAGNEYYVATIESSSEEEDISAFKNFVRWLTDWIEYEI